MQIQVGKLREALDMLKPAVSRGKKVSVPVTQNAWLGDGKAVATNLEVAVRVNLPDIAGETPVLLPFKEALEFLKRAPGHRMAVITAEGKSVRIAVDNIVGTFQVEDVQDFPALTPIDGTGQGVIDGDALVKALLAVAPYAAGEQVRPVLCTVCLTPGDTIEVACADGFRLAWETVPGRLASDKPMLIPTETVEALVHLWKRAARPDMENVSDVAGLARAKRLMRLGWNDGRLQVSFGDVAVIAQLTQGTFPNYKQLVPTGNTTTVTIMADEMEWALKQIAPAAKEGTHVVRMSWEGEQLVFSSKSEKFEMSAPVSAACTGPGKTAASWNYLMDYCRGRTGQITLAWSTPSSPILFSHRDHPHVVLMPMFVQWDGKKAEDAPAEDATPEVAEVRTTEEAVGESQEEDNTDQEPAEEAEEETAPVV